jgi:hypothetical protein
MRGSRRNPVWHFFFLPFPQVGRLFLIPVSM